METIKKYYIMQRNNASTKMPVFFFNEMLNKTPAKQFNEFINALNAYVEVGNSIQEKSIIYFHKDDQYQGFATLKQIEDLVKKISKIKINNLLIIDELKQNKLISPIATTKSDSSSSTMAMAVTALDLDEKAKEIKFTIKEKDKPIEDIVIGDIKSDLPGFQVEIIKTIINDGKLDIYYTVSKDGKTKSNPFIKSISGFGTEKIEVSTARSIYEDMQIKTQNDASISKRFQTKARIMFTALSVMAVMSLIILVMVLIKMYTK